MTRFVEAISNAIAAVNRGGITPPPQATSTLGQG